MEQTTEKKPTTKVVEKKETKNDNTSQTESPNSTAGQITHKGFPADSNVQNIVRYAYKLWWYDFVAVLECENGSYRLDAVGDHGHAFWLCQMNDRFHKDIPSDYTTNWVVAVEYCYSKWKSWTRFYGPSRIVKGQRCSNYVKNRFIFE